MPIHHCIVFITSRLHLICELRVFLSNPDLFLQPLFFVMELSKTIFKHLSLNLLLFHVKLLAKLARAIQARYPLSPVSTLRLIQVVQLDVTKAEVMTDELLLRYFFGSFNKRIRRYLWYWHLGHEVDVCDNPLLTTWMRSSCPRSNSVECLLALDSRFNQVQACAMRNCRALSSSLRFCSGHLHQ